MYIRTSRCVYICFYSVTIHLYVCLCMFACGFAFVLACVGLCVWNFSSQLCTSMYTYISRRASSRTRPLLTRRTTTLFTYKILQEREIRMLPQIARDHRSNASNTPWLTRPKNCGHRRRIRPFLFRSGPRQLTAWTDVLDIWMQCVCVCVCACVCVCVWMRACVWRENGTQ